MKSPEANFSAESGQPHQEEDSNRASQREQWRAEQDAYRKKWEGDKEQGKERLRKEKETARAEQAESKRKQQFDQEFEEIKRHAAERAGGTNSPRYFEELRKAFDEWEKQKDATHKQKIEDLNRDFERKRQEIQDEARRKREGGGASSTGESSSARQGQERPRQEPQRESSKEESLKPGKRRPSVITRKAGEDFGITTNELQLIFGRIAGIPTITLREILMRALGITSPEELRSAYRAAVRKYHPDLSEGDKELAVEKIKIINRLMGEIENRPSGR